MSELQDAISKIMSDPEAMKKVQSLGEQLGISSNAPPSAPPVAQTVENTEMMSTLGKLAPLMSAAAPSSDVSALLNALRPFLSGEKQEKLKSAQRLISLIRVIPLIKDSGLFL